MKWVTDNTRRLNLRPHYERRELDEICDRYITDFLLDRFGLVKTPIPTDALEVLLESETVDYDPFADLRNEGINVEGMTVFNLNNKPSVYISKNLSSHYSLENRRRTTIAHELGHVKLHWQLFRNENSNQVIKCNREGIEGKNKYDWMEWQAYYASGAYLMPLSQVKILANEVVELINTSGPYHINSSPGRGLIVRAKRRFGISSAAVRVRLIQLDLLTEYSSKATIM